MFKVELDIFHNETARSDWADSFEFGDYERRDNAVISANAVVNRMITPSCGAWRVLIKDTETGEQTVVQQR